MPRPGFRYFQHLRETLYRYRVHAGGMSKTTLTRENYRTREAMYRRHRGFIDRHSSRKEFLGPGYWHSASAYCRKGTLMKSLALGLRAFLLIPDFSLARDLIRRNLTQALGNARGAPSRLADMISQVVNRILQRFDRRLQCDSTFRLTEQKRLALEELLALAGSSSDEPVTLQGIVFSKDRPTQLHALLVSYFRHAADAVPLHIIYKATTGGARNGLPGKFPPASTTRSSSRFVVQRPLPNRRRLAARKSALFADRFFRG